MDDPKKPPLFSWLELAVFLAIVLIALVSAQ
jgi:hypothetical protein